MEASTKIKGGVFMTAVVLLSLLTGPVAAQVADWAPTPGFASESFDGEINYVGGVLGIEAGPEVTSAGSYFREARCLAHSLSTPGQGLHVSGSGLHVSGSVGGLVLGEIVVRNQDGSVNSTPVPEPVGAALQVASGTPAESWLEWLAQQSPRGDTDIVIVVADDFAGGRFMIPVEAFGPQLESDFEALVMNQEVSHGALVTHHLNALLSASGSLQFDSSASDPAEGRTVWTFNSDASSRLIVQGVDLSNGPMQLINTTSIVEEIMAGAETYLGWLGQAERETHFVLNMSWVLLPCPTVEAFINAGADFATFEAYLSALEVPSVTDGSLHEGDGYIANVLRLLSWVGPDDSLFQALSSDPNDPNATPLFASYFPGARSAFVAASGNFGMDYQMLPADWPLVVGAGAPDEPPPPFSNLAEVLAPGAWFMLEPIPEIDAQALPDVSPQVSYAGTSFSAPMVSLITAIDLITEDRCTPNNFMTESPGLASKPPADVPLREALYGCANGP